MRVMRVAEPGVDAGTDNTLRSEERAARVRACGDAVGGTNREGAAAGPGRRGYVYVYVIFPWVRISGFTVASTTTFRPTCADRQPPRDGGARRTGQRTRSFLTIRAHSFERCG